MYVVHIHIICIKWFQFWGRVEYLERSSPPRNVYDLRLYLHATMEINSDRLNIIFLSYYGGIIDSVVILIDYCTRIFFIYYNDRDEWWWRTEYTVTGCVYGNRYYFNKQCCRSILKYNNYLYKKFKLHLPNYNRKRYNNIIHNEQRLHNEPCML